MISIITVAHRSFDLLAFYIDSFLEHNAQLAGLGQIEFIFVENSSDERTYAHAARLKTAGFSAHCEMTENRGFGAGCNAGAALAKGNLLAFANPDIRFLSDISPLEAAFGSNGWGGAGQVNSTGRTYAFDLLPEYRNLATDLARVYRHLHKVPALYRYCYPVGSFMMVTRKPFLELGGFDERFFLYFEEAELSRRLHAHLGLPRFVPEVQIQHDAFGTQSSSDFTFEQEAISMVKYSHIIGDPGLAERRARMLRWLTPLTASAAPRARYLKQAIATVWTDENIPNA